MKQIIIFLFFSGLTLKLTAQPVQLCLGSDATVCQGQTVQITNCNSGASPGGGLYLNAPTNVALGDDNWSGLINIGFTFSFYGVNYTQCVIGANGLVSFNPGNAGQNCPWNLPTNDQLPSANIPGAINAAMACYQDLDPTNANSGPIQYQTLGIAPNRKFVVLYNGVTMFSCTNSCSYIGYIFYESTNVIETFIGQKGSCANWNNNLAIQGTERSDGNLAHCTPGRNNTVWNASQDGRRWTPTAPNNTNNYTITQIPYVNINAPGGGNTMWQSTLGSTYSYNNGVLNVTVVPPGTTGYFLVGTSCGTPIGAISDTTFITRISVNATTASTSDFCAGGSGTATATPLQGSAPFQYVWTPGGQTTQTAVNLVAGNYQVLVTDANNCTKTVNVSVPNATATFSGSSTDVTCPGGSNGTATAYMSPSQGTLTYHWFDAGGQTTATATGLSAGWYHCKISSSVGCEDTVEVLVSEIDPMVAQIVNQNNVSCYTFSDGSAEATVTGGTQPYSFSWSNGVSSALNQTLPAGDHTVTITDSNNCTVSLTTTITQPAPLAITSLSPDMVLCPENSTTLTVQGAGGSSAYSYTWTENGAVIGTGSSIVVDPANSGTVYCVTLSEACGSPATDSCMMITFPTPIVPLFTPDITWACQPGRFYFNNLSNNPQEIASVLLEYGDGEQEIWTGSSDIVHVYDNPGTYTLTTTVTSVYGCVYTASFQGIVTVIAKPKADFTISSNPTTIFETTVVLQDESSAGVISWKWDSPGSVPAMSFTQNPTFDFPDGVIANYPIQLIVETPEGCVDTAERILIVNSDILFFAPNSFTPNGDTYNQTWKFYANGVDAYNFEVAIYNRWGEVIWKTHDINGEWDGIYKGVLVPSGIYTWTASMKDIYSDERVEYNGSIEVLR